ncbi:MAG TPA: aspartate aminotransferase family protein [Candidatus Limnocylindria bacterium]|nr:aspartate aminotransferase family protein [Candidatus Limnocylindria bacterium]
MRPVRTRAKFDSELRERSIRAKTLGSRQRFERAQKSLAGGVSSGLRRFARPYPLYFASGQGAYARDVDGNSYIDYGLAWGPLLLGQSPQEIAEAIAAQAKQGLTFGAQHDLEFEVAECLTRIIPCADLLCFANSGTEIVQLALRLARAYTGRPKFLKFEGHYHGWDDSVLVSYHPAYAEIIASHGAPIGAGAGQRPHTDVLIAEWNDRATVERLFADHASEISAVICEPLLCNSGCIPAEPGFLEFLRGLTAHNGALLIFDEVITGFRVHLSGAQGLYGVVPDLATYAKAIGGGLPLSALAGRKEVMELISNGKVVHAGTLNGNPIVLAAAKATLAVLSRDNGAVYAELSRRGSRLRAGIESILWSHGHTVVTAGEGAVFHVSFMERSARCYRDLLASDAQQYGEFVLALLDEGVLALPDGRWYCSIAHTDHTIDATLAAVERAVC